MIKCPICDSPLNSNTCSLCGYDHSRDYGKHPTFGAVRDALPVSALRSRRAPKDALACKQCGSTAFTIRIPDNTRRCQKCGWSPDPRPLIECGCGGQYFLVRSGDGALICPLCGKTTPLDKLFPRSATSASGNTAEPKPAPQTTPAAPPSSLPERSRLKDTFTMPPKPAAASQTTAAPAASLLSRYAQKPAPGRRVITAIAQGFSHTVALYSDGTVRAAGSNSMGECDVTQWHDIIAIAAGNFFTLGLMKNGKVVAVGNNRDGQCDVSGWTGITAIAAGANHSLGLKKDGTAEFAGYSNWGNGVTAWRNLKAVSAGVYHSLGLSIQGSALSAGQAGHRPEALTEKNLAANIAAVDGGDNFTIALCKDGTVAVIGVNTPVLCNSKRWSRITAIAAGRRHAVGLKSDGTVLHAGEFERDLMRTEHWTNITAIAAGGNVTTGLKQDGTLVCTDSAIESAFHAMK